LKKKIAIIGGGACALMLGCELDSEKFDISIYDKNVALGRKFLVAGDGGLNLTHSEDPTQFVSRYTPSSFLEEPFQQFSNQDFTKWLNLLGIETYVGTSGRVFPKKGIKPIDVLNTLLQKIKTNKVSIYTKHEWKGFSPINQSILDDNGKLMESKNDLVIFCLGGASWPVTGSNGNWAEFFKQKNITIHTFESSNCLFKINWPENILPAVEGKALKNCTITCGNKTQLGEVVITKDGMEGSGIYPLSPQIREQLKKHHKADIYIDMKPTLSKEILLAKLNQRSGTNTFTDHISKQLNLNTLHLQLLKNFISKDDFLNRELLVQHIKKFNLSIVDIGPIEQAISTVGGISLDEIDANFELKKLPNHFAIGEMLDFDAPTGGYLLQSCFTMAKHLADFLNFK
jgi:uncharacterized flavoprotein (TIGR03862 family)